MNTIKNPIVEKLIEEHSAYGGSAIILHPGLLRALCDKICPPPTPGDWQKTHVWTGECRPVKDGESFLTAIDRTVKNVDDKPQTTFCGPRFILRRIEREMTFAEAFVEYEKEKGIKCLSTGTQSCPGKPMLFSPADIRATDWVVCD